MTTHPIESRLRNFDQLLQKISAAVDADTQASLNELIRLLMDYHAAGLERLLDLVWESGPAGQQLIDGPIAHDELVSSLLLLHGLHPLGLAERVDQALQQVRPYMRSHGGDVALLGITPEGVVRLRLDGTCHGCPSSRITLKFAVEKAIYTAAPDAAGLEVEGAPNGPSGQAITGVPAGPDGAGGAPPGAGWIELAGSMALPSGALRVLPISGQSVLFCRVGESLYAYHASCPGCAAPLDRARLEGIDLTCTACGRRYDVLRAGRCLDQPALHLEPIPLLEESGKVRIALTSFDPKGFPKPLGSDSPPANQTLKVQENL